MARRYRRGRFRARASKSGIGASFGKLGVKLSPTFLGGIVVGMTNLDDKLPKEVVLATAVAPISGIGAFKGAAQGIVLGNLLQGFMGGKSLAGHGASWGL